MVTQVLFGPGSDGGLTVSAVGQGLFRCYKYAEQALKPQGSGLAKREALNYTAHAWVVEGAPVQALCTLMSHRHSGWSSRV